jgi:uncharacterized repeat protein (TIGR02543 family)
MYKLRAITILFTLFISACTTTLNFEVSFESNGGSLVEPITTDGTTTISPPIDPIKEGFTFAGWYWDNDTFRDLFTINSLLNRGITSDFTVYAKWNALDTSVPIGSVKVTFETNGGTPVTPTYVLPGKTILIPSTTKDGYTLDGWYTSVNGGITLDERWSFINNFVNNDITLFAKWTLSSYTVTYQTLDVEDTMSTMTLSEGETVTSISLGASHSALLTSTGRLFTWGSNSNGQLGDGTTTNSKMPTDITNNFDLISDETLTSVVLGGTNSAALTSTGRLFTWGSTLNNRLQTDFMLDANPKDVTSSFNLLPGESIASVALGYSNFAALTSTGRLFTWGNNWSGQLGDNTTTNKDVPNLITDLFNLYPNETIVSVSLGAFHAAALTSTGRLFTWGNNWSGQLGNNTTTPSNTPSQIDRFNLSVNETISSVVLGGFHSAALTSKGRLFTWGSNNGGQLGDNSMTQRNTPTLITDAFDLNLEETISSIHLGAGFTAARTSTGRLFTWGSNNAGQLGNGTTRNTLTPTQTTDNVSFIALGGFHSMLRTQTGQLYIFGLNDLGQLGNGTTTNESTLTVLPINTLFSETKTFNPFNTSVVRPNSPIRTGFSFDGWYTDVTFKTLYNFTSILDQNITLYARWIPNN